MGDSAGGGFVLSFCQYLNSIGLKQPSNIIVFSPWVDISLSGGNYEEFKDSDPILGEIGLREIGKSWAGDFDTHDFKVSPLPAPVAPDFESQIILLTSIKEFLSIGIKASSIDVG